MAWGRWDCTQCGQRDISGSDRQCPTCGDPRQQHELDAMRPPDGAEFTSASLIATEDMTRMSAGADWSCGTCGSNNSNDAELCARCGASRDGASSMGNVGTVGFESRAPFPTSHSEPQPEPQPERVEPPTLAVGLPADPWRRVKWIGRALLVVLGLMLVMLLALVVLRWWGSLRSEESAVVTRLQWEHRSQLLRWESIEQSGWGPVSSRPGVAPVDGQGELAGVSNVRCEPRRTGDRTYQCPETYEDSESYDCGVREECKLTNNGNGSYTRTCEDVPQTCQRTVTRTRTKFCTEPVTREWCTWTTEAWSNTIGELKASGEGHEGLYFPAMAAGPLERVRHGHDYSVSLKWGDHQVHRATLSREEYDGWQVHDRAVIILSMSGEVVGFHKPDASR